MINTTLDYVTTPRLAQFCSDAFAHSSLCCNLAVRI